MPLIASLVLLSLLLAAAESPATPTEQPATRQYTFAWKFTEGNAMAPRGGTTKGEQPALDTEPGPEWKALREPGLTPKERDRRAILAMAGGYRTSFDFIEVAGFTAGYTPPKPYQSWGTEKVYVVVDEPGFISLQHILVMVILGPDGKPMAPMTTKHWRQDWRFEPTEQLVYRGHHRWQLIPVHPDEATGAWRQSVWQVDDSPRYSGVGRWQHFGNYSTWVGDEGWRPLPRREYSVRSDYHVLVGTNRHTITPLGWVHEQQNNKVKLDAAGHPDAVMPVLGREFGFNRYERIHGFDWATGDAYVEKTATLWAAVRRRWDALAHERSTYTLKAAPDQGQLFMPLFQLAGEIEEGKVKLTGQALDERVKQELDAYLLAPGEQASTRSSY
jgi:hypothetical protein